MIKGGYKIVNFNGTALSGNSKTIPGIYAQIVDDYDKAILVSGVSLNGELQDDSFASVKVNEGSVDLTVYGGVITVTEDDEVTFADVMSPSELTAEIGNLSNLNTAVKTDIVNALNSKVKSTTINSASAITHKLNIPTGSRHYLIFVSTNPSVSGLIVMASANSVGVLNTLEIVKGSSVTVSSDVNELTVTLTSSAGLTIFDLAFGDFVSLKS